MKKIYDIFLALTVCFVVAFSLTGCKGTSKNVDSNSNSNSNQNQSIIEQPEKPENEEKDPQYDYRNNF